MGIFITKNLLEGDNELILQFLKRSVTCSRFCLKISVEEAFFDKIQLIGNGSKRLDDIVFADVKRVHVFPEGLSGSGFILFCRTLVTS